MPFSEILCRIFAHFPDIIIRRHRAAIFRLRKFSETQTMQKLFTLTFVCLFLTIQMAEGQMFSRNARVSAIRPASNVSPQTVPQPMPAATDMLRKSNESVPATGLTYTDGKTHVLLIGVNHYHASIQEPVMEGQEHLQKIRLSNLTFCVKDMQELKRALVRARFCYEEDVQLLVSGAGGGLEPTKANVEAAFQTLLTKIEPGDRVLFAFSGHGLPLPLEGSANASEDFLACADARVIYDSSPLEKRFITREGIISRPKLEEALDATAAGPKLVFIDACRHIEIEVETAGDAGDSSRGIKGLPKFGDITAINSEIKSLSGLFRFSSCLPGEFSYEHPELGHGVFTHFIIKGLRGESPRISPGKLTLQDLRSYVRRETQEYVKNSTSARDRRQSPILFELPVTESRTQADDIVLAYYSESRTQDAQTLRQTLEFQRDEIGRERDDVNRVIVEREQELAASTPPAFSTPPQNNIPQNNTAQSNTAPNNRVQPLPPQSNTAPNNRVQPLPPQSNTAPNNRVQPLPPQIHTPQINAPQIHTPGTELWRGQVNTLTQQVNRTNANIRQLSGGSFNNPNRAGGGSGGQRMN